MFFIRRPIGRAGAQGVGGGGVKVRWRAMQGDGGGESLSTRSGAWYMQWCTFLDLSFRQGLRGGGCDESLSKVVRKEDHLALRIPSSRADPVNGVVAQGRVCLSQPGVSGRAVGMVDLLFRGCCVSPSTTPPDASVMSKPPQTWLPANGQKENIPKQALSHQKQS